MKSGIGEKIRQIREMKGLSQEYMANRLGVSQRAYSKLETNETKIDWEKITRIAEVFEIEPMDIISFDDNLVFNNCHQSGKFGLFNNNNFPEKLIEQYEKRIKSLENELDFLKEELKSKRNLS